MVSPGGESSGFEEVSRVAATLYLEMKKCVKQRNLVTFNEAVMIAREMLRQGKLPCSTQDFIATLATHTDSEGRNLMHEAARAAVEGETRFFLTLSKLRFPYYNEDNNLDTAAFIVCQVKSD